MIKHHTADPFSTRRQRNRRIVGTTLLLLVALSGGCADSAKKGDASLSKAAPAGTGLNPYAFKQAWAGTVPVDKGDAVTRIFTGEDVVLAMTPKNVSYTVKKTTGVLLYYDYVEGGDREVGRPVILPQHVVYPSAASLQVFKRKDGAFDHAVPLDFSVSSNAAGSETMVYFGGDITGGRLAAVDVSAAYNPVKWTLLMYGEVAGAPALFEGIVFVGSADGGVRAINQERRTVWALDRDKFDTGGAIVADLKADDGGVYAPSTSGRLVCIDRNTGRLKWQYFASRSLVEGPVVTKSTVYQPVPDVGLVALDKVKQISLDNGDKRSVEEQNRTPRWTSSDAVQVLSEDALHTYVRTADNVILALDKATGDVRYNTGHTPFTAFATNTTDSTIYAATAGGQIYALKPIVKPGVPGYQE